MHIEDLAPFMYPLGAAVIVVCRCFGKKGPDLGSWDYWSGATSGLSTHMYAFCRRVVDDDVIRSGADMSGI